ncbi:hypothetical protein [Stenotrophomonas sp. SMYL86]|uniref:hypothetical protein n=1 Tax=Stenotrophomonas sp. SMYL86 TaxID=3076044 RepID=UPI002E7A2E81|nr:hypothetical protein [Stenotrophomonas sp. SMYL86]
MNNNMAERASERLDAQIADALFGQPGMSKMDVANRLRELRGDGAPVLSDTGIPTSPSTAGQGDALAEAARRVVSDIDSDDYHGEISEATYAALQSALAARQPVGQEPVTVVVPGAPASCKNCGGTDLEWFAHVRNHSDVQHGRLIAHDMSAVFVLGCNECSETLLVVKADDIATLLNAAPPAQAVAPEAALLSEERAHGETIDQRDRYHEVADELAAHIAAITGTDIGEHSSANCPWQNAIEAAEGYKPAQAVDLGQFREAVEAQHAALMSSWCGDPETKAAADAQRDRLLALIDSKAVGQPEEASRVSELHSAIKHVTDAAKKLQQVAADVQLSLKAVGNG